MPAPPPLIRHSPLPPSPSPMSTRKLVNDSPPSHGSPTISRTQPSLITNNAAASPDSLKYSPSEV